ncbi:MAG: glycosyltransferase, partial [Cyanobacteriota bacterium]|nr:glycosyltransferase [Cyanobacteriota bacterium]
MSQSKKLLYLSVYDPHVPIAGAGTRGMKFVENLANFFTVDLIYLEGSGQKPQPEITKKYQSNLQNVRSKTQIKFTQFDYFLFSQSLYQAAVNKLENNSYDWLLCDYGLSATYGTILSKKFNIPLIYCSHNIEYLIYWDKGKTDPKRWILLPYVYWMEKAAVQQSRILVAISQDDTKHYKQYDINPDKILVIPQGFDELKFNPFY